MMEQVIAIGVSSVVFATIFLGYNIFFETFDQQLIDTRMWVDLREGTESMKADLRDANAVTVPPTNPNLLVTFTRNSDGGTYSYYINGNNALVREQGVSGPPDGGRVVTENVDPATTTVTMVGNVITIHLASSFASQDAVVTTSVRPRNL